MDRNRFDLFVFLWIAFALSVPYPFENHDALWEAFQKGLGDDCSKPARVDPHGTTGTACLYLLLL